MQWENACLHLHKILYKLTIIKICLWYSFRLSCLPPPSGEKSINHQNEDTVGKNASTMCKTYPLQNDLFIFIHPITSINLPKTKHKKWTAWLVTPLKAKYVVCQHVRKIGRVQMLRQNPSLYVQKWEKDQTEYEKPSKSGLVSKYGFTIYMKTATHSLML